MKLLLLNTATGLRPMYDTDYDEKRKLKIGEVYTAEVRVARNLQFHRKYFALINCAWEYQSERVTAHFQTVDSFRKTVEVAAGHCERVYSLTRKEWLDIPKSISFDKMDDTEFGDLYERVKDVLFNTFLRNISENEFMAAMANF